MARDHNAALATKSHEQTLSLREEKNWIRLNMESPMIAGSIEMESKSTADSGRLIQVAIVDDQRVSREGLRLIIDGTPGYRCTQTFETVEDGLHGLAQETPDVLLLDIHLPGMGGSEGVLLFRRNYPSLHVVMLSYLSDDDHVFQSICNGACGYILKKTPPDRLLQAISDAMTGGTPLSPEIARRIINFLQKAGSHNKFRSRLTRNELGLLELLAQGYTNQSAAEKLGASINTIRDGMRSIYEKIHWHLKSEARSEAL